MKKMFYSCKEFIFLFILKIVNKPSKNGFGIQDPEKPFPDPGFCKAPDPGSRTATLFFIQWNCGHLLELLPISRGTWFHPIKTWIRPASSVDVNGLASIPSSSFIYSTHTISFTCGPRVLYVFFSNSNTYQACCCDSLNL